MSNYSMKYPISYGADTFCVVGVATPTASTPTAVQYDKLIMVLICERRGGTILDAECNMVVDVTSDYIASLLIGHSLYTELEIMVKELQEKYNGISQKALIVALRDAHSKTKDRGALPKSDHLCASILDRLFCRGQYDRSDLRGAIQYNLRYYK